jgi:hypothetical protein
MPDLNAEVDFEVWSTYFKLALEGTASSMSSAAAIVRQADAVAAAAAKRQAERKKSGV